MLEKLDALLAEVVKARNEAGKPDPKSPNSGAMVDRQSFDEFKRAARDLETARNWLKIHADRVASK